MRTTDGAERVVAVLDLLGSTPDGLGVSAIADELGVHRSTTSRLMGTLAGSGIVERDPATRRYRLGPRLVGLAATAVARLPVVSQARPELEQLSAATSETANLAILDRFHVVYVDQVTPAQTVVMASWVGRRSPVHASSSGKVLVAFGDPKLRETLLHRRLDPLTERTVVDPDAESVVDRERFFSKSRNTPFHGMRVKGRAAATIVGGRVVFMNGEVREAQQHAGRAEVKAQ